MLKIEGEPATRTRFTYRGKNLYIVVSEDAILINTENHDKFRTIAGMALVENLANELLATGEYSLEDMAGICFSSSYMSGCDLPGLIHDAIMHHVYGKARPNNIKEGKK